MIIVGFSAHLMEKVLAFAKEYAPNMAMQIEESIEK